MIGSNRVMVIGAEKPTASPPAVGTTGPNPSRDRPGAVGQPHAPGFTSPLPHGHGSCRPIRRGLANKTGPVGVCRPARLSSLIVNGVVRLTSLGAPYALAILSKPEPNSPMGAGGMSAANQLLL